MARLGGHAIVIGASMGGLLAARALADHCDQVTILERDALPTVCEPRKGVPQGRHTHGLLARGREVLDELFPGLSEELTAEGAISGDVVDGVLWFNHGFYLRKAPSKLVGLLLSRPMLEGAVRRRVLKLANVRLCERCDALEPLFDREHGRVTGLRVARHAVAEHVETMNADIVIDATGRGSQSAAWLDRLGYAKPREETVRIAIGYKTRLYRRRPEQLNGKVGVIVAACHPDWRFGALLAQEGERWTVSLDGYLGEQVPADEAGFLEFARTLPTPEIFETIRNAEPLSPIIPYQFSANLRRHYEELSRFPEGFLAYGDALCSFNPVYGQGMTVACIEALILRECLAAGTPGLARRFFRKASALIDIPWQIAVGSDLQHPQVQGKRSAQVRFINWYIAKLFRAAQHDGVLAARFVEVANLTRQPPALLDPRIALRVWKGNRRPSQAAGTPAVQPL
jgi:2-polyprenyl-6-methoxyphenol hydroxylase-like FAD-dependent oxidoreductase